MRKIAITLLLALLPILSFSQGRQQINLNNNWLFTPGYEVKNNVFVPISIPHTWNMDAMSGKADYYRGFGNYLKKINVPADWEGKMVYLRFGAVNHTASVFVNGKLAGEHFGGYTAFGFDISKDLKYGAENTIGVRVSNALDLGIMPLVGDFNFYGGIYRDVDILLLPKDNISPLHLASDGVRVIPGEVSAKKAEITVKVALQGAGKCNVAIMDASGKQIASASRTIEKSDAIQYEEIPFTIKKPHLWNGLKDPYQYSAKVTFGEDNLTEKFGLRYFEVNDKNEFVLNGEVLQMRGVGRHQDYANVGNAIYRQQMEEDVDIMLEMGVNTVRLTHYPHDPYFIDLCDEKGIIVWSEIPFVGPGGYRDKGFVNSERFKENGRQQLSEMIEQLYNHPSILMWGLFNEIKETGDNPVEYVKELNAQAKKDDPSRLTVAASNQGGALNTISDLIGFNQYFGWYGGTPASVGTWGAQMRKDHPKMKLAISEYGAGASPYHQQDTLLKPVPTSRWHPENWQTHFHEVHWKIIDEEKYFWGTYVWVMFDFYAAHRTEGERDGINDKGLVSSDRKIKKDAFYFYKANWNDKEPFVYIAERRNDLRDNQVQTLKVFSNTPEVELFVNGTSIGKRQSNGHGTFLWENCNLNPGNNTIIAKSTNGSSDEIVIKIR